MLIYYDDELGDIIADECADCEHFRCTADEPQKIMEKCYSCKWWNYSYGCSNKKGICEFEPLKDEQSGKE